MRDDLYINVMTYYLRQSGLSTAEFGVMIMVIIIANGGNWQFLHKMSKVINNKANSKIPQNFTH